MENKRENNQSAMEMRFSEVYAKNADAIFRFCWFRLFNRSEAKDMVQEAFLRYWRYLKDGKEVLNDRALVYKIARNLVLDANDRRVPVSLEVLSEQGFDPPDDSHLRMTDFLDGARAMKMLNNLDPVSREAIVLRYVEGLSSKEIGEITGDNEGAVNVRIHRSLKKLRSMSESDDFKKDD